MKALFVNACAREGPFPALLKLYLEQIRVNGITFCYGEDGRPQRLCACENPSTSRRPGAFCRKTARWSGSSIGPGVFRAVMDRKNIFRGKNSEGEGTGLRRFRQISTGERKSGGRRLDGARADTL